MIDKDNKVNINDVFEKKVKMSSGGVLNTDGKSTFADLKRTFELKSEKINYDEPNHWLFWLNKIVSLIKGNIKGIYHGVSKRELALFMNEQEWRYNHRYIGQNVLVEIQQYMINSKFYSKKMIKQILDSIKQKQNKNIDHELEVCF